MKNKVNIKKEKFAFIAHPPNMPQYKSYINHLKPGKKFDERLLLKLFEWAPSYIVKKWDKYEITANNFSKGLMIMVPFLPEMKDIKLNAVKQKIEKALEIAAENKCTVAALGAFTSIVLQGEEAFYSEKYNIKITSGNNNTCTLIIKSIIELAEYFDIDFSKKTMAIIGASGDIGSGCALYFGDKVNKIYMTARSISKLNEFAEKNKNHLCCETVTLTDNKKAIENADIVIFATSSYCELFSVKNFKQGTIICDASAPLNVKPDLDTERKRFLYHGGIAKMLKPVNIGFDIGLAHENYLYGCLTEGLLHCCYDNLPLSWGRGNITREKINKYLNIYNSIPDISTCFSVDKYIYSDNDLLTFKNNFKNLLVKI